MFCGLRSLLWVPFVWGFSSDAQTTNIWTNAHSGAWSAASNWSGGAAVSSTNTILQFNADGATVYAASNNLENNFLLNQLILNSSSTDTIRLFGG